MTIIAQKSEWEQCCNGVNFLQTIEIKLVLTHCFNCSPQDIYQEKKNNIFLKEMKQENLSVTLNSTTQDKRVYQWKTEEQKRHNTYRKQITK